MAESRDEKIHRVQAILGHVELMLETLTSLDRTSDDIDREVRQIAGYVDSALKKLPTLTTAAMAERKEAKKQATERRQLAMEEAEAALQTRHDQYAKRTIPPEEPCCRCKDLTTDRCKKCFRPVCYDCSGSSREPGLYCLSYSRPGQCWP